MMSKKSERAPRKRYEIGKIAAAHGIRGDMLLLPLTDFPERFFEMESLDVKTAGKPMRTFEIRRIEPYEGKGTFFLHLNGIETREAAEALKGASVTVARDERAELEEGEYWLDDIIGLNVVNTSNEVLGVITEVMPTGSNDVYVIKTPDGSYKAIPATADVVKKIDLSAGTLEADIPEGLWD